MSLRIFEVDKKFQPYMSVIYPDHQKNKPMIEERALKFFSNSKLKTDYIYLPIFWTQYFIDKEYGNNIKELKDYIQNINLKYPKEKFFTIVQYDGGILSALNNSLIFAASGNFSSPMGINSNYVPIPLLSESRKTKKNNKYKYRASFVGNLSTHPIRLKMYKCMNSLNEYYINESFRFLRSYRYASVLKKSLFALSPRGYGPASFRMYEAIDMEIIPIYISDEFWLPYSDEINWEKICILIKPENIKDINDILTHKINSGEYIEMQKNLKRLKEKYFSWNGCLSYMKKKICS